MRVYLNIPFNNYKHFRAYCRKIISNKLGHGDFIGSKKFNGLLNKMWTINNKNEIENFLYRIMRATPEQIEASLRRLRGDVKPRPPARHTGMYGMWSDVSKQFVFGIQKPSKNAARRQLMREIGYDSYKWRFFPKPIKDCEAHREMFHKGLIFKEGAENDATRCK